MTVSRIRIGIWAMLLVIQTSLHAGETWPSFQNGGRVSLDAGSDSVAYALSDELAWTAELTGYGQSSPVVCDRQVYVTSVTGANKETYHVTAYGLDDGARLWESEINNATPQESSNYVSKAAPTPAADEDGLICFFEGGNLVALSHGGETRWERNLVDEYGSVGSRHGLSASVEQDDDSAYIWVERSDDPYVLSVNKQTGETNWKVSGVGATSWATPRLVPVDGGPHLVLSAIGSFVGLNPRTGEQLWRLDGVSGNSTPTPVPLGDGRFLIGATVGRGESGGGNAAESNGVVQITKSADGNWAADYAWRAERATSSFGSPVAHDGMAYFINRGGVLYGLDLQTGEERFAERLEGGSAWATPIGIGNRVYVFGKDGRVNVVEGRDADLAMTTWESLPSDPEPAEAGRAGRFSGSVLYAAVWCDGLILMRRGDRLFAVRVVPQEQ